VGNNASEYLKESGLSKLGWRAWRRHLLYCLSGQERYRIEHPPATGRRVLWLYWGIPQIGDALMDLAPRSLLTEMGFSVDLYTHDHLRDLFLEDAWFTRVISDASMIDQKSYDFAIIPSNKHRSLQAKIENLPHTPWLSLHGDFTGPEFQRADFSTQRLIDFLGCTVTSSEFSRHARQKLKPVQEISNKCSRTYHEVHTIALAIGGVDALRVYQNFSQVITGLIKEGYQNYILVGGCNGNSMAEDILQRHCHEAKIVNHVGKTSLHDCHSLLSGCHAIIAADGGIMHLATTTNRPVISLFQSTVAPQWRLPSVELSTAIQSRTSDVNDIPHQEVISTALLCLQKQMHSMSTCHDA
jgi:heptosyltransferase-2